MFKFTIRELLLLTFWIAVLCVILLAMRQAYTHMDGGHPWYLDRAKLWRLDGLNLGLGVALGGITGFFAHEPWRGPLIGLAIGFIGTVCWTLWLANAVAGAA